MDDQTLKLGFFLKLHGHHIAAWRHHSITALGLDAASLTGLGRTAEAGGFDLLFLADHLSGNVHLDGAFEQTSSLYIEPLTALSAIAAATTRIGLVGTLSTTFDGPYHVARRFRSLDHLSGGRAGWNVVTSSTTREAQSFGAEEILDADSRYERGDEFLDLAKELWDAWEADAIVFDQATGRFADAAKVHRVSHHGAHFAAEGGLNLPASPQGRPLIVQAGASETGQRFAARHADVVFTAATDLAAGARYSAELKEKVAAAGRDPRDVLVMPGLCPIVGRTASEAAAKERALLDLITPAAGISLIYNLSGVDLTGHDIDGAVPDLDLDRDPTIESRYRLVKSLAEQHGYTIRELYESLSFGRGHLRVTGTATDVADIMEAWLRGGAADGFNVMPPVLPADLDDFVELVVPELERRGLVRRDASGATLRERLGLVRLPATVAG